MKKTPNRPSTLSILGITLVITLVAALGFTFSSCGSSSSSDTGTVTLNMQAK